MADLHTTVLARLDTLLADHQPMAVDPESGCCPGGCIADAARALRTVVDQHRPAGGWCACGRWVWPCRELEGIAYELRVWQGVRGG